MDSHRIAWDVFTRSIDRTELERERMRAGNLAHERFGSKQHELMLAEHDHSTRRYQAAKSVSWEPVAPEWWYNVYKVRVGQHFMKVSSKSRTNVPMECVLISGGDATLYAEGRMICVPLANFHGGRGGWEQVIVNVPTPAPKFEDWQLAIAERVARG